jgi:hypothetical protein
MRAYNLAESETSITSKDTGVFSTCKICIRDLLSPRKEYTFLS